MKYSAEAGISRNELPTTMPTKLIGCFAEEVQRITLKGLACLQDKKLESMRKKRKD